jgi:hypothetical protein
MYVWTFQSINMRWNQILLQVAAILLLVLLHLNVLSECNDLYLIAIAFIAFTLRTPDIWFFNLFNLNFLSV